MEESEKSPERVPRARRQKRRKSAPRRLKRVARRVGFRTFLRLWSALFRHFRRPSPGYPFQTLFGLFRNSGPERPERPCVGRGRSQQKESQHLGGSSFLLLGLFLHPLQKSKIRKSCEPSDELQPCPSLFFLKTARKTIKKNKDFLSLPNP